MEPSVTLHGRKKDHDVITKAAESAQKNYKEVSECLQKCSAKAYFRQRSAGATSHLKYRALCRTTCTWTIQQCHDLPTFGVKSRLIDLAS